MVDMSAAIVALHQIMKKSAAFKELDIIEPMDHVETIWPLRATYDDECVLAHLQWLSADPAYDILIAANSHK
jgi:hypothetical protein